ncbi:hypothetical protein GCM10020221_10520 [Streptomyces thioluteus]|uniref:Uncharacterized protein n=1 Tax=Streptomyces thioluteus TaxID=66431 RepID=A0ABP6J0W0_STRTU
MDRVAGGDGHGHRRTGGRLGRGYGPGRAAVGEGGAAQGAGQGQHGARAGARRRWPLDGQGRAVGLRQGEDGEYGAVISRASRAIRAVTSARGLPDIRAVVTSAVLARQPARAAHGLLVERAVVVATPARDGEGGEHFLVLVLEVRSPRFSVR